VSQAVDVGLLGLLLRLSELDLSLALRDLMLKLSTLLKQLVRGVSTFHPSKNLILILLDRFDFHLLTKVFEFVDFNLPQFSA
jgi:hypothetical protein